MRFIPNIPKVPLALGTVSCALLGLVPHTTAGAEEDPPEDVVADAEEWCAELEAEGYDTTGCVETYVAVYNGELDPGSDGEPYFDQSVGELDLPCTDSVEYQAFLEDPTGPDPCAVPPGEPVPCGPVVGETSLTEPGPDPCPVPEPPPGPPAPPPPPKRLTWKPSFTTKQFIAAFGVNQCGTPLFVKLAGPRQLALYAAFCVVTANSYKENPPNGNNANPLDARIWSKGDLEIVCEENKALPIAATLANGGTNSGFEVGNLRGVVFAPRTRNQIVANGTFGFVTFGRPNPLLEPTFAVGGPRLRRDIWNKVTGTVTCKTAQNGMLSASIASNLAGTGFPSHRLWWNGKLSANRAQGPMSVLWNLPAVPNA